MANETSTKPVDVVLLKSLMGEYASVDEELVARQAEVEATIAKLGGIVQKMADAGAKQFKFAGKNITVVSRTSKKNPERPATYFLKGFRSTESDGLDLD